MRCPYCECTNTKVVDSRESGMSIRRRRECALCGRRFTTYERVQMKAMMVVKRDGRREEFSRAKLWASLTKACAKRPLATGSIDKIIDDIEANLSEQGKAEFPSQSIGEMVMSRLSNLDQVAYIRFASVYLDFSDVQSFKTEIDALLETGETHNGHADINQLALLDGDLSIGSRSPEEHPPQAHSEPSV
ncbi:MAG: transcriptional repressor NrdR [Chloroflexi bacterium]|nr:transcriptional repressor NrdR [Chloroflexota bacterium]